MGLPAAVRRSARYRASSMVRLASILWCRIWAGAGPRFWVWCGGSRPLPRWGYIQRIQRSKSSRDYGIGGMGYEIGLLSDFSHLRGHLHLHRSLLWGDLDGDVIHRRYGLYAGRPAAWFRLSSYLPDRWKLSNHGVSHSSSPRSSQKPGYCSVTKSTRSAQRIRKAAHSSLSLPIAPRDRKRRYTASSSAHTLFQWTRPTIRRIRKPLATGPFYHERAKLGSQLGDNMPRCG